jgi:hypothetical protein
VAVCADGPLWLPATDPEAAAEVQLRLEAALTAAGAEHKAAVLSYDRRDGTCVFAAREASTAAALANDLHVRLNSARWSAQVLRYRPFAAALGRSSSGADVNSSRALTRAASKPTLPASSLRSDGTDVEAAQEEGEEEGLLTEDERARAVYCGPRLRIGVSAGDDGLRPVLRAIELCDAAPWGHTYVCGATLRQLSGNSALAIDMVPDLDVKNRVEVGRPEVRAARQPVGRLWAPAALMQRKQMVGMPPGAAVPGLSLGTALLLRKLRAAGVAGGEVTSGDIRTAEGALRDESCSEGCAHAWRAVSSAEAAVCLDRLRRHAWAPSELLFGALTFTRDLDTYGAHSCLAPIHLAHAAPLQPPVPPT